MLDILCSKIGGIWCYWPGSEIISGLIKIIFFLIIILIFLLIYSLLKKRFAKKPVHTKHRPINIKNIHAGKKTKKKS